MKKLFTLMLILCIAQTLYAQEIYRVNTEKLNIRKAPAASSSIIGYLDFDTNVEAIDTANSNWYKIKANNGIGYVNSQYLVKISKTDGISGVTDYNLKVVGIVGITIILISVIYYLFQSRTRKYVLTVLLIAGLGIAASFCYTTLIMKPSIKGLYVNTKGGIYQSFDFKGENTVSVKDGLIGLDFAVGYIIDGNIIRITSNSGDILLNIKDENTLIGEGFSTGIYKKQTKD